MLTKAEYILLQKSREPPKEELDKKSEIKNKIKTLLKETPDLDNFLEENHVKGRFIRSFVNQHMTTNWNVDCTIRGMKSGLPIMEAFTWSKTTEKFDFWRDLNIKFNNKK